MTLLEKLMNLVRNDFIVVFKPYGIDAGNFHIEMRYGNYKYNHLFIASEIENIGGQIDAIIIQCLEVMEGELKKKIKP